MERPGPGTGVPPRGRLVSGRPLPAFVRLGARTGRPRGAGVPGFPLGAALRTPRTWEGSRGTDRPRAGELEADLVCRALLGLSRFSVRREFAGSERKGKLVVRSNPPGGRSRAVGLSV